MDTKGFANDLVTFRDRDDTIRRVQESERLIVDTIHGNETAVAKQIEKIHDRHYPETLKGYGGDILLVGISYDKNAAAGKRKHQCKIEKYVKLE